jgi:hypothetical protein
MEQSNSTRAPPSRVGWPHLGCWPATSPSTSSICGNGQQAQNAAHLHVNLVSIWSKSPHEVSQGLEGPPRMEEHIFWRSTDLGQLSTALEDQPSSLDAVSLGPWVDWPYRGSLDPTCMVHHVTPSFKNKSEWKSYVCPKCQITHIAINYYQETMFYYVSNNNIT